MWCYSKSSNWQRLGEVFWWPSSVGSSFQLVATFTTDVRRNFDDVASPLIVAMRRVVILEPNEIFISRLIRFLL